MFEFPAYLYERALCEQVLWGSAGLWIYYVETTFQVTLIGNILNEGKKDCMRIYRPKKNVFD